jgi:hypothetical protein
MHIYTQEKAAFHTVRCSFNAYMRGTTENIGAVTFTTSARGTLYRCNESDVCYPNFQDLNILLLRFNEAVKDIWKSEI